jgi:hypothetical protein
MRDQEETRKENEVDSLRSALGPVGSKPRRRTDGVLAPRDLDELLDVLDFLRLQK